MSVYDSPFYYEIAFSYQQVKRQVDFFQTVAKRFCKKEAGRFLDIGCGPSPQLREIARRGYEAVGLDVNPKMLQYLRQKALEEGLRIETVQADMRDFRLEKKCDFAFCLSGSVKVDSNHEFLKHLSCVGNSLDDGGIYMFENEALELGARSRKQHWTMKNAGIVIKTTYEMKMLDPINQVSEEKVVMNVIDHGRRKRFVTVEKSKDFAPQELKSLIELSGYFKFLGFFKHLSIEPLRETLDNNIVLMQKVGRFR